MPRISVDILQAAIAREAEMSLPDKVHCMEEIRIAQPVLFESIEIQRQLGNELEDMQVLFDLLLTIHLALDNADISLQPVTRELHLAELRKFSEHMNFTRDLNATQHQQVMQQYHNNHAELPLLLWAQKRMIDAGFADFGPAPVKHLMLAGVTLVNCIAAVDVMEAGSNNA